MDENLVGRRFKELIGKSGKSQKEMAALLNTSTVFISMIVSGKRGLGVDIQRRLRELGFDVDWVLTGRRDINDGGKKGELIARYIVAGHKKIVIETHEVPEGVRVDVYSQLQDYSNKTSLALVAEPVSEFEEIKQEVVIAPVQKVQKAAATAIQRNKG